MKIMLTHIVLEKFGTIETLRKVYELENGDFIIERDERVEYNRKLNKISKEKFLEYSANYIDIPH